MFAEMLLENSGKNVKQPGQDANPSGQKMQRPAPSGWSALHEWEREGNNISSPHSARFAPVQAWMSQKNCHAANEEPKEADRSDPVGDAYNRREPRRIQTMRVLHREACDVHRLSHGHWPESSTGVCGTQ